MFNLIDFGRAFDVAPRTRRRDAAAGIKAVRMMLSPSAESRDFYARLGFEPATELNILRF